MLFQVYSPHFLPWLIVHGQPSPATFSAFGVLRHEGSFAAGRLTTVELRLVQREIAALGYARVPAGTAQRLMALSPIRQLKGHLTRWLPNRRTDPRRA